MNGPVRTAIGLNSRGNLYGSGFRANATIGRAIRLGSLNAFGLRPHVLDQATQGTPAKYSCCIAENEEDSPWAPLHVDNGLAAGRQRLHVDRHPVGAAHRGQAHDRPRAARGGPGRLDRPHRGDGARVRVGLRGAQPRARAAARLPRLVQAGPEGGDRRARVADLPGAGGVGQGGDRQGHRLAAARRPPGRAAADGAVRPGHAGAHSPLGPRRAGRRGGRAQRGGVVGGGDVRRGRPPAVGGQGRRGRTALVTSG